MLNDNEAGLGVTCPLPVEVNVSETGIESTGLVDPWGVTFKVPL